MPDEASKGLPRPFYEDGWRRDQIDAARALWGWHLALSHANLSKSEATPAYFEEAAVGAEAGNAPSFVPASIAQAAFRACREHRLPMSLLAEQVRATARLRPPVRFQSQLEIATFVEGWAGSHARLLAGLAGLTGSWQELLIKELAYAFFFTGHLARLKEDLQQNRLFIPLDAFEQADAVVERLRQGEIDEPLRRVLWRQMVRARDGFAQGQALVKDLDRRQARAFKRWWLGGLEVLAGLERRDFDVWSRPMALSSLQKWRLRLQALAGRTTFKH